MDLTKISGEKVRAWWFNPRTGEATEIGSYETEDGVKRFKAFFSRRQEVQAVGQFGT